MSSANVLGASSAELLITQFSPFSRLPSELFIEIIAFAIARPNDYTVAYTPRVKPRRPHALLASRAVSRSWYSAIAGSPRLWSALRLDGEINSKNLQAKAIGWAQKALGRVPGQQRVHGEDGPGITELVITAAQEVSPVALQDLLLQLFTMGALKSLQHFTISFVDGNRTAEAASRESKMTGEALSFLHTHLRLSLHSLTLCTRGRLYPDFEIASVYLAFPSLHTFRIWGINNAASVAGVRSEFLSRYNVKKDESGNCEGRTPTNARHLSVGGAVLVNDTPCHLADFPLLQSLEIKAVGAATIWELLSAPRLKVFHTVIYGEQHVVELPLPAIAEAWECVESLRLGGAKRFAPRLLDQAVLCHLSFPHLTHLDLAFASLSTAQLALFDASNAPSLISLNIPSTTCATLGGTFDLPSLTSLRFLNISHTTWTTDSIIRSLLTLTPRLERLSAIGAINLTGRPLLELVKARMEVVADGVRAAESSPPFSGLVELKVEGCSKIEPAAVDWLRKYLKAGFKFTWLDPADKARKRARLE